MKLPIILLLLCLNFPVFSQTSFTFTLKRSYRTSAGVFKPDGTLIRALWKDVTYPAGTYTQTWDGMDDNGAAMPTASYQVKVLYHNCSYVWDGAIGSTAQNLYGPHTFHFFHPIIDMAAVDTAVFYTGSYTEGNPEFHWLNVNNSRYPTGFYNNCQWRSDGLVATDDKYLYEANNQGGYGVGTSISFVDKLDLASKNPVQMANSVPFRIGSDNFFYPNYVIDSNTHSPSGSIHPWIQNAASGLDVQRTGNLLAVAHYAASEIRLFDKTSGALLSKIPCTLPTAVAFSSDGDLWAIVNGVPSRYTNPGTNPVIATVITGTYAAIAIDVDPGNPNIVMVADGGASQQVKCYNKLGQFLWALGEFGGFKMGGSQIRPDKFWFWERDYHEMTFLTILKDHTFWIGDMGNSRAVHFDAKQKYIEQIASSVATYSAAVGQSDPTRVFNGFMELKVDYTKPLLQSWQFVKQWGAVLPTGWGDAIRQVVNDTVSGYTYCMLANPSRSYSLAILSPGRSGQIKPTAMTLTGTGYFGTLNNDMSITRMPVTNYVNGTTYYWSKQTRLSTDSTGNPTYSAPTNIASVVAGPYDPLCRYVGFGDAKAPITTSGNIICYDPSTNNGYHIGAIKTGGTTWLWKSCPVGSMNRKGNYPTKSNINYAGDVVNAIDKNIVAGFHGENWMQNQACQFYHYFEDGLLVGEFGNSSFGYQAFNGNPPAFAGNDFQPSMCKVANEYYLWVNDESANSPQRWHMVGANNIHELGATISLNGSGTLSFLN